MLSFIVNGGPISHAVLRISQGPTIERVRGQAEIVDITLLDERQKKEQGATFSIYK